jgi:hypothetical protein
LDWRASAPGLCHDCSHHCCLFARRFPRLLRVREDKAPEDATTAAQVAEMYRQQAVVQAGRADMQGVEDDEP